LEKENNLNKAVIEVMLSKQEHEAIKGASEWDDETNSFKVPLFYFKGR